MSCFFCMVPLLQCQAQQRFGTPSRSGLTKNSISSKSTTLRCFPPAKDRLLDPALGRIRAPSNHMEDDIILATDSSHYALGAVLLQKLPPTSDEIAAGVPADAKQLYIVQVF